MSQPKFGEVWRDALDGETVMIIVPTTGSATALILVEPTDAMPVEGRKPCEIDEVFLIRRGRQIGWEPIDDAE